MKRLLLFLFVLFAISGCYSVDTKSHYNKDFTRAHSESNPIYLNFPDTKNGSFYIILSRDTNISDYKMRVRWHAPTRNEVLFNGYDSSLKFFINKEKILSFQPTIKPKMVAYNINSNGHEEEAVFMLTRDELYTIAYANEVSAELTGRYTSIIGYFTRGNTLKAFRNFAENSH